MRDSERLETDLLIIGSGAAGARAAIEASCNNKMKIVIVTKGRISKSGSTITAGMDMAVDGRSAVERLHFTRAPYTSEGCKDSKERFFEDIIKAGRCMSNQRLVKIIVNEAADRAKEIEDWGLRWRTLGHNPGHTYPRSVYSTGIELMHVLKNEVEKRNVEVIEDTMVIDLLTSGGKVAGAFALDIRTGEPVIFNAKSIILATGGGMRIYKHTTAPEELTGDGQAMAYRAGVELIDMEFPQFMPMTFVSPPALDGIIFPYLFSCQLDGQLLNVRGEKVLGPFASFKDRIEHTDRSIEARAIWTEVSQGRGSPQGGLYLSIAHLPEKLIKDFVEWWGVGPKLHYPKGGFDIIDFVDVAKEKVLEVAPACHFFCGGVKINEKCETGIPGLYVAGELAGGVCGANRLSGVAITVTQVFGARAGRFAAEYVNKSETPKINKEKVAAVSERVFAPLERKEGISPIELRRQIQELAWQKISGPRDGPGLKIAVEEIERMKAKDVPNLCCKNKTSVYNREWTEALQVENMLCTLEMIARAALLRTESRGFHLRSDYPASDDTHWLRNIVIKQEAGRMKLTTSTGAEPERKRSVRKLKDNF